jgi:hypothetical protein
MGNRLEWVVDPGHGWLSVPLSLATKVEGISTFSYMRAGRAYLEQDCDAALFLNHYGIDPETITTVQRFEDEAPCRNFARFAA